MGNEQKSAKTFDSYLTQHPLFQILSFFLLRSTLCFKFKTFSYYIIKTCQTYLWMFDIDISRFHIHSSRGQHCLQDCVSKVCCSSLLQDSWHSSKFPQGFLGFLMGFRDSFRPCIFPFIAFCIRIVDIQAPCWPNFFISSMRQLIALI